MARIYENGAELNTTTAGIEIDATVGTGTVSVQSTTTNYSRYAYTVSVSSVSFDTYFTGSITSADAAADRYIKFDLRIAAWSYVAEASPPVVMKILDAAGDRNFQLELDPATRAISVLSASDATVFSGPVLATGTWYTIEIYFQYGLNASTATLRVNGVPIGKGTVGAASSYHATKLAFGIFNNPDAGTSTINIDNIIVNDTSGTSQNSWVGNQALLFFRPISAGDAPPAGDHYWAASGGTIDSGNDGLNYQEVDEITPDTNTTWIRKSHADVGQFAIDWYDPETIATTGHITSVMPIECVSVNGQMGGTGTTSRRFTYIFQTASGGTKVSSTGLEANANAWFIGDVNDLPSKPYLVSYPAGASGASVVNYQFGLEASMVDAREIRASTVWMGISFEYKPSNKLLTLLGCGI